VWKSHWKLTREPFPGGLPYVSNRSHDEAVARLVDTIETGGRRATVRAAAGLGKSSVLMRALAVTRGPSRRQARSSAHPDGASLFVGLAEGLGLRVAPGLGAFRLLEGASRRRPTLPRPGLARRAGDRREPEPDRARRSARPGAIVPPRHASRRAPDGPRRGPALRRRAPDAPLGAGDPGRSADPAATPSATWPPSSPPPAATSPRSRLAPCTDSTPGPRDPEWPRPPRLPRPDGRRPGAGSRSSRPTSSTAWPRNAHFPRVRGEG
jgi:hypothetical protein